MNQATKKFDVCPGHNRILFDQVLNHGSSDQASGVKKLGIN